MNALLPVKWNHPYVLFEVNADASYVLKLGAGAGVSNNVTGLMVKSAVKHYRELNV
jgi:hypothetical protein